MPQTTPFSFHCMICFEEFHPEHRYPVVLPCGHTYVCNACADRIDICMECREPLFTVVPRPQQQTPLTAGGRTSWSSASSARYGARGPPETRYSPPTSAPTPPVKKRLPLPKNVVLLSLIEATELAAQDARKDGGVSPKSDGGGDDLSQQGDDLHSMIPPTNSILDAEDIEEEKIKVSTSIAVGVAGTYAVAERKGLDIFPSRPPRTEMGPTGNDEDVDTLVRFFHMDHQKEDDGTAAEGVDPHPRLSFGDRVQVVSLEDGWAKLARGYGFVRAGRNQLVKGAFWHAPVCTG